MILRFETRVMGILLKHDKEIRDLGLDPDEWQVDYSLLEHCLNVSQMLETVGSILALGKLEILQLRMMGLLHDVGKTNKDCWDYRLKKSLGPKAMERVRSHSTLSTLAIYDSFYDSRKSDHGFLARLHAPVCFHHVPEVISDPDQRRDGILLRLTDAVQGWTEERHRPALTLPRALERVEGWVEEGITPPGYEYLRPEYREAFEVVKAAFILAKAA